MIGGPWRSFLFIMLLALALVVTGANLTQHEEILRQLEHQIMEAPMQVFEATYPSEGVTMTLRTPRLEGEELEPWIVRHREALLAMKAAFPPDPPKPE